MMVRKCDLVDYLMPEAIKRVSSNYTMKFSKRNLFYAVRELWLKEYSEVPFYDYNSFTQDYLIRYQRLKGKIELMVAEPRGKMSYPDEYGWAYDRDVSDESVDYLSRNVGVGNAIIFVEKGGLWAMMHENRFEQRLDKAIIFTGGYATEAARLIMSALAERGYHILPLRDYDVNGIWIFHSLQMPTKRRDFCISPERIVDVGFNWEDVKGFLEEGYTPEPVKLKKEDLGKLNGLLERGLISEEEYEFLRQYRFELNAVEPERVLKWLEEKLERLGFWKTVPSQEELDKTAKGAFEDALEAFRDSVVGELKEEVLAELGITTILDAIRELEDAVEDTLTNLVQDYIEENDVSIDLKEFEKWLRENMDMYWRRLAKRIAQSTAKDRQSEIQEAIDGDRDRIIKEVSEEDKEVASKLEYLKLTIAEWLEEGG